MDILIPASLVFISGLLVGLGIASFIYVRKINKLIESITLPTIKITTKEDRIKRIRKRINYQLNKYEDEDSRIDEDFY